VSRDLWGTRSIVRQGSKVFAERFDGVTKPVLSMDQLYSQARVAAFFLLRRRDTWALACGGTAWPPAPPVGKEGGGEAWHQCVKDPQRAMEKAAACYGGDLSRLADICRVRIALPDPAGVLACMRAVRADPGVRIVRLKNGMTTVASVCGEGLGSSGFRVSCAFLWNDLQLQQAVQTPRRQTQ
jgi:hypothetical protein